MTPLPDEEPPCKIGVRLRIKYNRTTIVLNILLISVLLKNTHCLVAVAFFGTPCSVTIKEIENNDYLF